MLTNTEIIVLRTIDFRESSQISTVLSREHGKMALIAKGVRKPKSRFAGMLQPGTILDVVYYYKPTRSVQTLREASFVQRMDGLHQEVEKMAVSMSFLELISQLVQEGEENEPVVDFTRRFLIWLNEQKKVTGSVFPYLQVRLAALTGLELQMDEINEDARSGYLNIEAGIVSQRSISSHALHLTRNQLLFLKDAAISRKVSVLEKDWSKGELSSLIAHLDKYFRYHFEGLHPRKSDAIFDQILKDEFEKT